MNVVIILSMLTFGIPLFVVIGLLRQVDKSITGWMYKAATTTLTISVVYMIGPWGYLSYYLRYLILVILVISLIISYYNFCNGKSATSKTRRSKTWFRICSLIILTTLNIWIITGRMTFRKPLELEFPLKNGTYYILQGGNGGLNNFFHSFKPELRYALDIVKLNQYGNRADGLRPEKLDDYYIYNELVYSPCDGMIIEVIDGVENNTIGNGGDISSKANEIKIKSGQYEIHLVHLLKNSILVKQGDYIQKGQILARVGNSGFTNEPHLHIHVTNVTDSTEAFPMTFNGRFLSVNNVFKN